MASTSSGVPVEEEKDSQTARPKPDPLEVCPWAQNLTFRERKLEATFERGMTSSRVKLDAMYLKVSIPLSVLRVLTAQADSPSKQTLHDAWLLFAGVLVPAVLLWLIGWRRESYKAYRSAICGVNGFCVALGCILLMHTEYSWRGDQPLDILLRILHRSPILGLVFPSLGMRTMFWRVAVVQFVTMVTSAFWIRDLCSACDLDEDVAAAVNMIGYNTEDIVTRIGIFGLAIKREPLEANQYSCWLVGGFYHVCVGYIIPCAALYASELYSRVTFLHERVELGNRRKLEQLKFAKVVFAVAFVVISVQVCWFMIKGGLGVGWKVTNRMSNLDPGPCMLHVLDK